MSRRRTPLSLCHLLAVLLLGAALAGRATAAEEAPPTDDWAAVEAAARGQTVYFNAWGGDRRINAYIDWAADRLAERHDVELVHVKVGDIAQSGTRILA